MTLNTFSDELHIYLVRHVEVSRRALWLLDYSFGSMVVLNDGYIDSR
jgi:hypothetical protein